MMDKNQLESLVSQAGSFTRNAKIALELASDYLCDDEMIKFTEKMENSIYYLSAASNIVENILQNVGK